MADKVPTPKPENVDEFGNADRSYVISERWRRARRNQEVPNEKGEYQGSLESFPVFSSRDEPEHGVFLVFEATGAVHNVPDSWVTEDGDGRVYVRGNAGYGYASKSQVTNWFEAQGLDKPKFQSDKSESK